MAYSLLLNGCLASIVGQRRAEQKFRSALFQKNQAMPRSRKTIVAHLNFYMQVQNSEYALMFIFLKRNAESETKKFDDVISRTRAL
ncbi:hypothetical protein T08_12472 [Trichinella sp. T8]|nr:hypothetical protein T08_12472 [Trichinella sp. T8]